MNSITDAHVGVRVTRAACAYTLLLRANQLQTAVGHLPGPPGLIYMYMYMYMYQYSCVMQTGMYMYMYEPLHSIHHRVSFRGGRGISPHWNLKKRNF